jgi:competence protein ComEC
MTGGGPTVVRASIMAVIGMLAVHLARPHVVLRALALAGFVMVLWNPFVLAFDPGFQLSFVATLGLVLGAPIVQRFIPFVPDAFQLREIVAATCATQLAVLPLLIYQVGMVSVVAPVVNMLVLPLIPFTMLFGFLAGIAGMVSTFVATPLASIAYALLSYVFLVVEVFAKLPFSSVELPPVHWLAVSVMYVCMAFGVWRMQKTTTS